MTEAKGPSVGPSAPFVPGSVRILEHAKKLLSEGGWGKGKGGNDWPDLPFNTYCAYTACHRAGEVYTDRSHGEALAALLLASGAADHRAFYHWHDAPERTLPEVLAVFDKAILIAGEASAASARNAPPEMSRAGSSGEKERGG